MKFRFLVLTLVTALVGASVALAGGSPNRGSSKPTTGCKAKVMVVLRGTLANDPVTGDTSLQLTATKSNRHGRAYLAPALQPLTINVDARTKIRRTTPNGEPTKTLDSLALGDLVKLKAKACKAELRNGGTPDLTARHIKARPPASP